MKSIRKLQVSTIIDWLTLMITKRQSSFYHAFLFTDVTISKLSQLWSDFSYYHLLDSQTKIIECHSIFILKDIACEYETIFVYRSRIL